MAKTEAGIKRSSSLRFLKCFTAGDDVDDEFCNPGLVEKSDRDIGRWSDLPVAPGRTKKCFRMICSGVTMSVFSDSFRAKKHRRRKHSNESSNKLFSTKPDNQGVTNSSNIELKTNTYPRTSSSSSSSSNRTYLSSEAASSSSSSSSSSSLTSASSRFSSSRSLGEKPVNSSSPRESEHKAIDTVLCLLLVTLLAVIVWGKICAIVCTSTWLWVVSYRRSIEDEDPSATSTTYDPSEEMMESAENKKRIVLGGFLEEKLSTMF